MPWLRAKLRGKLVYARATEQGELASEAGRVEIRYNERDGRMYRAAARNLTIADGTLLPEDTCGPAEEVARPDPAAEAPGGGAPRGQPAPAFPEEGKVIAYTDGACSGNPGPAGLGLVVLAGDNAVERYEYLGEATNNIAELTAILRALEEIDRTAPALIHTDSQYAIGVVQRGWKAKANAQLVAALRSELSTRKGVRLVYVKGHAGIPLNERADELARRAISERASGRSVLAAKLRP